jgi:hypothetical protein
MTVDQRRAFLQDLVRWGAGAAAAPAALAAFAESLLAADSPYVEVKHYRQLENKRIQCFVCPLNCLLDDGYT